MGVKLGCFDVVTEEFMFFCAKIEILKKHKAKLTEHILFIIYDLFFLKVLFYFFI